MPKNEILQELGARVRKRRKELGLSQEELALKAGYSNRSSIIKLEKGEIDPSQSKLAAIAKALNVLPSSLTAPNQYGDTLPVPNLSNAFRLPLLGNVACGEPIFAEQEYETVELQEAVNADFCLRAKGNSMVDCGIMNNSLVFCKAQDVVDNGQIAVVIVDDSATVKRFYNYGEIVILKPCNSEYEDLVYRGEELEKIRVIGKVVGCLTRL